VDLTVSFRLIVAVRAFESAHAFAGAVASRRRDGSSGLSEPPCRRSLRSDLDLRHLGVARDAGVTALV